MGNVSRKEEDEKMTSKHKNQEELSTQKIIGRILEVLAIPLFIVNIVLLNRPDPDLRTIGILIVISNCLFIPGLILSHLPHQKEKNKEES